MHWLLLLLNLLLVHLLLLLILLLEVVLSRLLTGLLEVSYLAVVVGLVGRVAHRWSYLGLVLSWMLLHTTIMLLRHAIHGWVVGVVLRL